MKYPLMKNNITRNDLDNVIKFLKKNDPILTQSTNVKKFENLWSKWLGVKYSVFVNSGSSANLMTIRYLNHLYPKGGEIITSPFNWTSDITSILFNGFKPVFVDINMKNLSADNDLILKNISSKTKAVLLTHAQGFNGLSKKLLNELKKRKIHLIEDVCESHGASFSNKKLGSFGLISNFSFYYAHHMSTIEGGMICTNSKDIFNFMKSIRSHGILREVEDENFKKKFFENHKDLNKDFIFPFAGFNMRNNEIGGVLGISQLKNIDKNIKLRQRNFQYFLRLINKESFYTDFDLKGSSNYAFNLILKNPNADKFRKLCSNLSNNGIEFRIGSVGGGNQLRQPYLKKLFNLNYIQKFKNVEHMHFFSLYIGNYPSLKLSDIKYITKIINSSN